ncbi:hypothetical protein [Pectinatus haikarae]|uniref:hypothetical protein n=1 Tax=Pectinatus haikarae TaxID=349096 RepID=UPI0018C6EA4E|nr:hypothetical protein [Pectinatus haikarae]
MKKILLFLFLVLFYVPTSAHAEIRQTESGNVVARESAFTYMQAPEPLPDAASAGTNKPSSVKPENIFSVYVKTTRFYNRSKTHYRLLRELSLTSHTESVDLLFDKDQLPKIEYTKDGSTKTLPLKKVTYTNSYFMSFKVTPDLLTPLYDADKVEVVFPEIVNGSNVGYTKDKKGNKKPHYQKKDLKKDSILTEQRYELPKNLIAEWQLVLSSDLTPGTVEDTLQ